MSNLNKTDVTNKVVSAIQAPLSDVPELPQGAKPVVVARDVKPLVDTSKLTDEEIVKMIPYHSLSHLVKK